MKFLDVFAILRAVIVVFNLALFLKLLIDSNTNFDVSFLIFNVFCSLCCKKLLPLVSFFRLDAMFVKKLLECSTISVILVGRDTSCTKALKLGSQLNFGSLASIL